jgi:predicted phage terminase large subunit-like protein
MSSGTEAQKTLAAVVEILQDNDEDGNLHHFFPTRVLNPSDKDVRVRADYLRMPRKGTYREGTVEARGIDSKVTGGHFTDHINDDLIDENMVDSEVLQSTAVNRLKRSDSLFVNPAEDIELNIGTRWPGIFYRWLLEDSGIVDEYWSVVLGCYVDDRFREFMHKIGREVEAADGTPIWPEHFSMDALAAIERKSPYDFVHQWLNLEVDEGTRRFNREDFQHYKLTEEGCVVTYPGGKTYTCPLSNLYITMTIDPATGEHDRTDQSAITVCGFDRKTGNIYVLDVWQGRVLPHDLINKIIDTAKRWKPHLVAPEDVSFQKTLKHFLKQEMIQRGVNFHIKPVKPGRLRKGSRILDSLQPFVANHQLYVMRAHDASLVSELVALQVVGGKVVGRSPNLADSLSYHSEFWRGQEVLMAEEEEDDKIQTWGLEGGPAYGLEVMT